jgi:hypothetical protein
MVKRALPSLERKKIKHEENLNVEGQIKNDLL